MEKDKDSFLAALQREILRHNFRYIRRQPAECGARRPRLHRTGMCSVQEEISDNI
jgi:hypothetical protein